VGTTDILIADIARTRETMDRDLRALQARFKHQVNPRVQARKHPLLVVGVVTGLALTAVLIIKILRS
jgi:hypothetical protein